MATRLRGSTRPLLIALVLLAAALPEALAQDNYPNRLIRIIAPTAPGGPSDIGARLVAQGLAKTWGQPVVVENRPGAGTIIGSEIVAKAPPDGYTLLMCPSTLAINPVAYKKMPYDALRDFAPITQILLVSSLLVVHPSLPAKSVKEMIALARARPGEIQYASAGHGTNPHLTMELFASMAKIKLAHVPYKGDAPAISDLLGGHVMLMAAIASPQVVAYVRAGKMRALGVTTATRSQALPDVPTVAEEGLPGYESLQWVGLLAPAGTPREIIARLHKEAIAILRRPETKERFASFGSEVVASTPEEFAVFLKAEIVKWARVAKVAEIQPE